MRFPVLLHLNTNYLSQFFACNLKATQLSVKYESLLLVCIHILDTEERTVKNDNDLTNKSVCGKQNAE